MHSNLNDFLSWMSNENFYISPKISIVKETETNYGVITKDDVEINEILFKIPRKSVLNIHNSEICDLLVQENVVENSKWGSLILCILHELFLHEKSRWYNYLKMFPNFDNLKLPMFWNDAEMSFLKETGIEEAFNRDLKSMKDDYETWVSPFILKHSHLFNVDEINFDTFKYYVAFVMAYSFTKKSDEIDEDSSESEYEDEAMPYLVPMADVLNHMSKNNAELIYEEHELVMLSISSIKKGEKVWNTYGDLPNCQLLQQYGFTLSYEDNDDDVVEINLKEFPRCKLTTDISVRLDVIKQLDNIVLGKEGFLNTNQLSLMLHTLHLSEDDYKVWQENISNDESWEEENEDVELLGDYLDQLETVKKIPQSWKSILKTVITHTIIMKENALNNLRNGSKVEEGQSCPRLFVVRLLDSHINILKNIERYL